MTGVLVIGFLLFGAALLFYEPLKSLEKNAVSLISGTVGLTMLVLATLKLLELF